VLPTGPLAPSAAAKRLPPSMPQQPPPPPEEIFIYNPLSLPFGVLSSKSRARFKIEKETWETVSEYVYVNLFSDPKYRREMSTSLEAAPPFATAQRLRDQEISELYKQFIQKGCKIRFSQNPTLLKELKELQDVDLIYNSEEYLKDFVNAVDVLPNTQELQNFYTSVLTTIKNSSDYFYDPLSENFISRKTLIQVLNVLETELTRTSASPTSLPPSMAFLLENDYTPYKTLISSIQLTELAPEKYKEWNMFLNSSAFDGAPINVNALIKFVKTKIANQEIAKEVVKFKDILFNTYLDYLLEHEYPDVEGVYYEQAKQEQLKKESPETIVKLKDKLYNIFLEGSKSQIHDKILQRIVETPKTFMPIKYEVEEDELEKRPSVGAKRPPPPFFRKLQLLKDNTSLTDEEKQQQVLMRRQKFLISQEEILVVENKSYRSVLHYVYDNLIIHLQRITVDPDIKTVDINLFEGVQLPRLFRQIVTDWTIFALKHNNEKALKQRFIDHPTLLHVLFQTDLRTLIWYDKQDPVLGTAVFNSKKECPNPDNNNTGKLLMFLRDKWDRRQVPDEEIYITNDFSQNRLTQLWLFKQALFYRIPMLLIDPTYKNLHSIFGITPDLSKSRTPTVQEKQILELAGMNLDQQEIAFPFIVLTGKQEFNRNHFNNLPLKGRLLEESLKHSEITRYFVEYKYRIQQKYTKKFEQNPRLYTKTIDKLRYRLTRLSKAVDLKQGVDSYIFEGSLLTGKLISKGEPYTPHVELVLEWNEMFKNRLESILWDPLQEEQKKIKTAFSQKTWEKPKPKGPMAYIPVMNEADVYTPAGKCCLVNDPTKNCCRMMKR